MRHLPTRLLLAALTVAICIVTLVPGFTAEGQTDQQYVVPVKPKPTFWQANGCKSPYSRKMFNIVATSAFQGHGPYTRHEREIVQRVVRCQHTARSHRIVKRQLRQYKRRHVIRVRKHNQQVTEMRSLLPYDCGSHGRWAIPCNIIACESGFSWSAYNPSGASGPYQLLGHGAPMPADTPEKRMQHHRIAAALWAGGAGRSQWVC